MVYSAELGMKVALHQTFQPMKRDLDTWFVRLKAQDTVLKKLELHLTLHLLSFTRMMLTTWTARQFLEKNSQIFTQDGLMNIRSFQSKMGLLKSIGEAGLIV